MILYSCLLKVGPQLGEMEVKLEVDLDIIPSMRQWASSESESPSLLHTIGAKS